MHTPIPPNRATFTAWQIAAATGGRVARVDGEGVAATGVTTDSRAVRPGCAFVALAGERFDGHDYLEDASQRGAVLLVVARGREAANTSADVVEVDDTLEAWGAMAEVHVRAWKRAHGRAVVGVTGSAGKTTTKEITAALLATHGATLATPGNLNNRVGVPAVALLLEPAHRHAVFELGMSVPGEMARISRMAQPDVGVLLNVGVAHAGGVGGARSDVGREKGALLAQLGPDGVAIVNGDDAAAMGQVVRSAAPIVTFGKAEGSGYRLLFRAADGQGGALVTFSRARDITSSEVRVPFVSEAQALDFLAALASVEALTGKRMLREAVEAALAGLRLQGRMDVAVLEGDVVLVDDTYNANPDSMRAALAALAELGSGRRKVAVLGEMKELGHVSLAEHEILGDLVAEAGVELLIGCGGELVGSALERARARSVEVVAATSSAEAGLEAAARIKAGDVVLVKGSRGARTEAAAQAIRASRPVVGAPR